MKHIKHIQDEDYDFSIKLMVPLLTILVCTICLCATTWAWYTASVSTGVNSIKAGVNDSDIQITYIENTVSNEEASIAATSEPLVVNLVDGYYNLANHIEYTVSIKNSGESTSGYHCMITVIYTPLDGEQITAVLYTDKFTKDAGIEFKLRPLIDCKIKIDTLWSNPPEVPNVIYNEDTKPIDLKNGEITFEVASATSLREEDTITPPPTYDYLIRFIDSDSQNYEIKEAITGSTSEGCISIEYNDYLKEGYELVISEDIEIDDDGTIWFEIDPEEQVNEFKLFYKMIETNDAPAEDGDGGETTVDGDNTSTPGTPGEVSNNENGGTNTSTPSTENESNPESQNNQQSQVNDSSEGSDSNGGSLENGEDVSSVEEGIDTTGTSSNGGTEESNPSSNDADSGSDEASE